MGEITDLVLDGLLCQVCGHAMPDLYSMRVQGSQDLDESKIPGYPRTCKACKRSDHRSRNERKQKKNGDYLED